MRLQSQVDFWNVNFTKYPNFEPIWAVEALLHPGDVLYLPPYWFHRVITEEPGIGLNVWSSSSAMKVEDVAKQAPIPFSQTWSTDELVLGLKLYSLTIVAHTITNNDAHQFLYNIITTLFSPIFSDIDVPLAIACDYSQNTIDQFLAKWTNKFEESLSTLVPLFHTIENQSIRELEVFTYLEKLVSICLGTKNVYPFLSACFLQENIGTKAQE